MVATTSDSVQRVMKGNRGKNTQPELRFRTLVHRAGLRYAIDSRPEADLNRRADLVFRSAKVAVFIHGCFWHGHQCSLFRWPKTNYEFWIRKILGNRKRDARACRELRKLGWKPVVVWECRIRKAADSGSLDELMQALCAAIRKGPS